MKLIKRNRWGEHWVDYLWLPIALPIAFVVMWLWALSGRKM